jgi:hypothetical protein
MSKKMNVQRAWMAIFLRPVVKRALFGKIVWLLSISLPMAQVPLTAPAHPAALEHIPPPPTHSLAPLGQLA